MKKLAIVFLLPAVLAAPGCIDFGSSRSVERANKPAVEEVKVPPRPTRKQDVDPNNPAAAVASLERELDFDQNLEPASTGTLKPDGSKVWTWTSSGK
jgi:hypothetical protein